MPIGTLPTARGRTMRTRRSVMLAVLAWLLAGLAAADRVRVEPQVGPYRPQQVAFHPTGRSFCSSSKATAG